MHWLFFYLIIELCMLYVYYFCESEFDLLLTGTI